MKTKKDLPKSIRDYDRKRLIQRYVKSR